MKENNTQGVEYLTFSSLEETGMVRHLFSTRNGGVSRGIFATMNLGYTRGDDKAAVDENFERIASVLGVKTSDFVFSHQTHTTNIRVVTEADRGKGITQERDYENVDGLLTNVKGIVLCTFYADCVPLFFVDPVKRAVGLAHSGWRGTAGRIGARMVERMGAAFGSVPADIRAAVGPSICVDCYEVSADVAQVFKEGFKGMERTWILHPARMENISEQEESKRKYQLDLSRANQLVLREAGVLEEHIEMAGVCTGCNPERLFSHRASAGKRGNLGAFLGVV